MFKLYKSKLLIFKLERIVQNSSFYTIYCNHILFINEIIKDVHVYIYIYTYYVYFLYLSIYKNNKYIYIYIDYVFKLYYFTVYKIFDPN